MINFLKKCFADEDGGPAGSTTFLFVLVACSGAGAWVYVLATCVALIGVLMSVASAELTFDEKPLISARRLNVLGYSWMIGLTLASFFAFDYRSAFFMSFTVLMIPPAGLLIEAAVSANKAEKIAT
jgi:hypothetical protein